MIVAGERPRRSAIWAIEKMADSESRAEAFVGLAVAIAELVYVDDGLRVRRRRFHEGRRASRWSVYMFLEDSAMLFAALDGGATMSSVADTIVAIARWWSSPGQSQPAASRVPDVSHGDQEILHVPL